MRNSTSKADLPQLTGRLAAMASRKKTLGSASAGFGAKSLAPELDRSEALILKKRWAEARFVLENISRSYPQNSDVATSKH